VLQEAIHRGAVEEIAAAAGFPHVHQRPSESLAFMSLRPAVHHEWHRPRLSRHAFLEIVPEGDACRIFGLHLSAVHSAWTERRRVMEIRALLASVSRHQHGMHVLVGDFNTLAPNERLNVGALPHRLRALVWMSGGRIRWRTIHLILASGYVDAFRTLHPDVTGLTFPVWNPHVRLDYLFVPAPFADRLRSCVVLTGEETVAASDHYPLLTEIAT
jgi:endonuclease/exonuclease/phosphatase family metal-dependent hydrolase